MVRIRNNRSYYIKIVSFLCLIVALITAVSLRSTNLDHFCKLIHELQHKEILDGEVLVVKGDTVVLHEQSKMVEACAQHGDPQFMIGSVAKQFTAVALLRALYDKNMRAFYDKNDDAADHAHYQNTGYCCRCTEQAVEKQLHEPLSHFLPADASVWNGAMPLWADKITLHHLLSHTAGIPGSVKLMFDRSGFDAVWRWLSAPHTPAQIVAIIAQEPLSFEPGTDYCYSNEGYLLLTEVVAAVSGVPFAQYIETMCAAVGMTSTHHPDRGTSKQIKQSPNYANLMPELEYNITNPELLKEPPIELSHDTSNACGAGGIISTVQDLLTWNSALHKTKILLPPPLYELLIKPNLKNYGYGIWNRDGMLIHSGKFGSYLSNLIYIPEDDVSIIVLCHVFCDRMLEKTTLKLETTLQEAIPEKEMRTQFIHKIVDELSEKYPATRGADYISKFEIKR
jgi:CubicO group peptidase (beta-lactamase class C family)